MVPLPLLSPLEPCKGMRRKAGNSAGAWEKERGTHAFKVSTLVSQ
jgi:hypothetical protein